ncbi:CheR family methyltransferase [Roseovarius salis]|uniref:CheR family methyltransferase n=1 Tax=Roseovarius salis TaxID=3376063 RepID=UPI0037C86B03
MKDDVELNRDAAGSAPADKVTEKPQALPATPDYKDYTAKPLPDHGRAPAPGLMQTLKTRVLYDKLLLPYALLRHRRLLRRMPRRDDHTYTCFLRAPSQLALLSGPVMDFIEPEGRLDIVLLACSNGAESYTIASWLRMHRPELDFHIHASDLHQEMIARAQSGTYSRDEVLHSIYMSREFLDDTFHFTDGRYVVRPEIRQHVSFSQASLLDGALLRQKFGRSPLVVAQNVLFHLAPDDVAKAFDNLVGLMAPRAVLLIEGMQLDLRVKLTAQYGLTPFPHDLRRIYEESRVHTPPHWWRTYWGSEPYIAFRRHRARRYGTAFFRDEGPSAHAPAPS